ncbi:AAA family ATPase [Pseudogemmobacter humi]|nr:AAA family ATPase [Pseudogemmobacter humi]
MARLLDAPVRMIDVGGGSAGFRISGTEKGWGAEQPGIPVETILATRVANPIMVVDEIDKARTAYGTRSGSTSITTSLLQMLEPGTARHFECPFYRIPFDMSRVVWVMTANDADTIPEPLRDRSRLFVLPKLSAADAVAHFDLLVERENTRAADLVRCRDFVMSMAERPEGISLRQITQLANAARAPMPRMVH